MHRVALASRVSSDAARAEVNRTRDLFEELAQMNAAAASAPPAIEWDKFKEAIKTPGVVEEFQVQLLAASSIFPWMHSECVLFYMVEE